MVKELAIKTNKLTKIYAAGFKKSILALNEVSINIYEGEIYALLGPNGAGKTTLTKILLGLIRPTSGEAFIFGNPVNSDWKMRIAVGYLPELFRVNPKLTAYSTLKYLGELSGLKGKELKNKIEIVLSKVGLSDVSHRKVETFSKGMIQRLGIAQALLNDPKILFLDEPTEGLDPLGRIEIRNLIFELARNGMTILLNSHLLSEVEMVANRIGILNKGKLVVEGALDDLLAGESCDFEVEVSGEIDNNMGEWNFQKKNSSWICKVQGIENLHKIMDFLKNRNISIKAIRPIKTSLEDLFVKYIRGE
ncbi:ABC-2 type transport system ATP-binding protein [Candidatus Kryptonium thompsonii]|uniref:ABC-2 type transport system ATP-binding protein n=1 Tax=Candidatus Kryptonium thompsonii TaxID=1633631 RepID=A0A0N7MV87_9BACT|nr:ABC transporter ATP-binding protein [Candidatus Kryptonium thompsoni]CUS81146.1 ABC-2 type transport system ATP-binding protein [Candidatus Kryptonium thompsoni]CUS88743.1 ABC-2 type transport system ATP-binding protein [Candidatus Kryptonium thompsoni]CUS90219.1 ABC-2 type transport system ATP-binding protein [Candidatus Kryptonium thompsoni]CUS92479.1 ABC-2 type transport system ATP-binding protein [Candidatus Kryptonium thompsoni]CUS95155.1 ABC-2 type transport system ATP-binding protein